MLVASGILGLLAGLLLAWRYLHRIPSWPERDAAWAKVDREREPVDYV